MWVGFPARDSLPDEAIENGLNDALSNQLGIYNPTYAFEVDADRTTITTISQKGWMPTTTVLIRRLMRMHD